MYKINPEAVAIARHIFNTRIDNSIYHTHQAWCSARDIFEYVLAGNLECLAQFDYMDDDDDDSVEY